MLRHVFCLGWGGRIEEGHGHEVLAPCPAVGWGLLGLELPTTREILNGNFKRKSGVCESPPESRAWGEAGGEAPSTALPVPGELPGEHLELRGAGPPAVGTRRRDG